MLTKCPVCATEISWSSDYPHRPFCSKRCQLLDLGDWAGENHTIPAQLQNATEQVDSLMTTDPEHIEAVLSQLPDDFFNDPNNG